MPGIATGATPDGHDAIRQRPGGPPTPGQVIEVVPGILWARLPLPFRLDHVNVYLIADGDGWVILDTGISNRETREAWQALLDGPLSGARITGLIVTHHHPDHIGLAGWLCETLDIPLMCSRTAFLSAMVFRHAPELLAAPEFRRFYARHGLPDTSAALVATQGHDYLRMVETLPLTFVQIKDGDRLTLGGRCFHVLTGEGHCAEQVMLHLPEQNLILAADQVIEKISPNVSISVFEPHGDPLGQYIESLDRLVATIPADALVLSGHRQPFHGLHARCRELAAHHRQRFDTILGACASGPRSTADLVPLMFRPGLSPHELSFAFTEALAHMNHLAQRGDLIWLDDGQHERVALA